MLIMISENGDYIGEVNSIHLAEHEEDGRIQLRANWRNGEWESLATYTNKNAALQQMDRIKHYISRYLMGREALKLYDLSDPSIKVPDTFGEAAANAD